MDPGSLSYLLNSEYKYVYVIFDAFTSVAMNPMTLILIKRSFVKVCRTFGGMHHLPLHGGRVHHAREQQQVARRTSTVFMFFRNVAELVPIYMTLQPNRSYHFGLQNLQKQTLKCTQITNLYIKERIPTRYEQYKEPLPKREY